MKTPTKDLVLAALEEKPAGISGQQLAMKLGLSRCSVWKAVKALQNEGYEIEAVTNRGYRLIKSADKLNAEEISRLSGADVTVFDTVTSTNIIAKERAACGAPHGTVIMAANQSTGRGRRGRSFASVGDGIYLSIVLRPEADYSNAPLITAAAAVAVYDAVKTVCNMDCGIKWVNDLYLRERKICGILCEAVTDMESGEIGSVIAGIGINFRGSESELPPELRGIVGFIYNDETPPVSRNRLAAEVIKNMLRESDDTAARGFIESYREHSTVIGQRIEYRRGAELITATALGIDDNCALEVLRDDGVRDSLAAGEVSVRKRSN